MQLFRLRRIFVYFFIFCIILSLTINLCEIAFLYLEIPIFTFIFITLILFFIVFSTYLFILSFKKIKNISIEIEDKIFGKRIFFLDTYEETKTKNKELFEKIEIQLKKNDRFIHYYRKEKIYFLTDFFVFILVIFILGYFNFKLKDKVNVKINDIKKFLISDYRISLPEFYVISKNIKIELPDYLSYDKTLAYVSNLIFEVKTNQLLIPEKLTGQDTLNIKIYVQKYGITRKIIEKTLKGTTKFLPYKLGISISYPFLTEPYEIEGIQDIEVYKNALITIRGEMTKEIKELIFKNEILQNVKGNSFQIGIKAEKTIPLNIKLIAFDNDIYEIKDFSIKVIPNLPPELKIEFPRDEVFIISFPWKLTALIRAIDDQGIKKINVECIVENESKYLKNLSYKKSFYYEPPLSKELEYKLTYLSKDIELLPGDKATFYIKAIDVFGLSSKPQSFSIYAPGFEWIDKMSENNLKQIYSIVSNLSKGDIFNEDIDNKGIEKEKALSDLSNLINKLSDTEKLFNKDIGYEETKEIIDRMKEISSKLEEFLKNKDEFFLPGLGEKQNPIQLKFETPQEYLWQMEKLLDSLEKQKEVTKKFLQIEEMRKLLTNLKDEKDKKKFENKLKSYKDYIKSKKENFDKNLIDELEKEAENLSLQKEESFNKSFEILEKLSESLKQNNKRQKETAKKQTEEILGFMLEETILCSMIIQNLKKNIFNFSSLPENSVITTKSIKAAVINLKKLYREKLGFYFLIYKDYYKTIYILDKLEKDIIDLEDHLRERRYYNFSIALPRIIIGFNKLYISLKDFAGFLDSKEFENLTEQSQTISLDNIIKMQQMITGGLKKMLSEKQGSPEYQQLREELERLQKAINESLGKLLKEGNFSSGKDIEEDMKDILKDIIEEKVTDKTVEKSKKLEEKLLNSRKGLTKKGLEEERKAESAKEYEITPPEDIIFKPELKKRFTDITNKEIPFYYKIMIEKYKKEMER
ncbi:MAG: hypothetical protein N2258_06615 [Brevinematales bacterium]|nr:hypothetical protein [Brevinematales bacterium]